MATTLTHNVDPDGGTGHDYDSLSLWEAGEQGDLTGVRDEIAVANCRCTGGTADTTQGNINGFTADATRYPKAWCDPAESYRHNGTWQTGNKYRLIVSAEPAIWPGNYMVLDGLQIQGTGTDRGMAVQLWDAVQGLNVQISNCILRGAASTSSAGQVMQVNSATSGKVWNCVIYTPANAYGSTETVNIEGTLSIYSSTLIGPTNGNGINNQSGTVTAKNCYAYGSANYAYYGTITKTTCASSDTTGSTGLQSIALNTTNFTNVTGGTENFDLPLGSALIDVGTNTSGDAAPLNFTTDIVARTRGATWDVGAFEYVAAGGANWLKERYWWSYPYHA